MLCVAMTRGREWTSLARDYEEQEPRPKFFRQSPAESESPQTLQFTDPEREQEQPAEDGCAESRGLGNDRLKGGTDAGDSVCEVL